MLLQGSEQQMVKALLREAITMLCKTRLKYRSEFCIEGLLGITLDKEDILLINIYEEIKNEVSDAMNMHCAADDILKQAVESTGISDDDQQEAQLTIATDSAHPNIPIAAWAQSQQAKASEGQANGPNSSSAEADQDPLLVENEPMALTVDQRKDPPDGGEGSSSQSGEGGEREKGDIIVVQPETSMANREESEQDNALTTIAAQDIKSEPVFIPRDNQPALYERLAVQYSGNLPPGTIVYPSGAQLSPSSMWNQQQLSMPSSLGTPLQVMPRGSPISKKSTIKTARKRPASRDDESGSMSPTRDVMDSGSLGASFIKMEEQELEDSCKLDMEGKILSEGGMHKCSICGYESKRRYNLQRHFLVRHSTSEPQHKCEICNRKFHLKSLLKQHEESHKKFLKKMY